MTQDELLAAVRDILANRPAELTEEEKKLFRTMMDVSFDRDKKVDVIVNLKTWLTNLNKDTVNTKDILQKIEEFEMR